MSSLNYTRNGHGNVFYIERSKYKGLEPVEAEFDHVPNMNELRILASHLMSEGAYIETINIHDTLYRAVDLNESLHPFNYELSDFEEAQL